MDDEMIIAILALGLLFFFFYQADEQWDLLVQSRSTAQFVDGELVLSNDNSGSVVCQTCASGADDSAVAHLSTLEHYLVDNSGKATLVTRDAKNNQQTRRVRLGQPVFTDSQCRVPIQSQTTGKPLEDGDVFVDTIIMLKGVNKHSETATEKAEPKEHAKVEQASRKDEVPKQVTFKIPVSECARESIKKIEEKTEKFPKNAQPEKSSLEPTSLKKVHEKPVEEHKGKNLAPVFEECYLSKARVCKLQQDEKFGSSRFLNNSGAMFNKPEPEKKTRRRKRGPSGCDVSTLF
jgi:hypothetical protein